MGVRLFLPARLLLPVPASMVSQIIFDTVPRSPENSTAGMDFFRRCPTGFYLFLTRKEAIFSGKDIIFCPHPKTRKNDKIDVFSVCFCLKETTWETYVFLFSFEGMSQVGDSCLPEWWKCRSWEIIFTYRDVAMLKRCVLYSVYIFIPSLVATHVKGFHWCFPVESGLLYKLFGVNSYELRFFFCHERSLSKRELQQSLRRQICGIYSIA